MTNREYRRSKAGQSEQRDIELKKLGMRVAELERDLSAARATVAELREALQRLSEPTNAMIHARALLSKLDAWS